MKKAKIAVLTVIMTLLVAIVPMSAFAATGLNDYESKLLDYAKSQLAAFSMNESQQAHSNAYLAQAESYLSKDSIDLTESQYNTCIQDIDKVKAILPADISKISVKELYNSSSELSAIVNDVSTTLGITINVSADGTITVSDKSGNTVGTTGNTVQQTGIAVEYLALVAAAFVAVIIACAFVAKKKNLFAKSGC